MAVLKHSSPTTWPSAPKPLPQIVRPSAKTMTPVAPPAVGGRWCAQDVHRPSAGRAFPFGVCGNVAKPWPLRAIGRQVNAVKPAKSPLGLVLSGGTLRVTMIRDDIKAALVGAMKGGDKEATATIRLIQSAIKNRDIELRTASQQPDDDQLVTEVLQKMIKQRRESVELYRKGNREELAAREEAEIAVIERFLPQQMSDDARPAPRSRRSSPTPARPR